MRATGTETGFCCSGSRYERGLYDRDTEGQSPCFPLLEYLQCQETHCLRRKLGRKGTLIFYIDSRHFK